MDPNNIDYSVKQWQGNRENQEDLARVLLTPDGGMLVMLADGMGGHLAGEVASREAISMFSKVFCEHAELPVASRLRFALEEANRRLADIQKHGILSGDVGATTLVVRKNMLLDNMGTTLVAAFIKDYSLWWLSVGDSHLLRAPIGQELNKLNEDHSMWPIACRELERGEISIEYALRQRSILRSAIMGNKIELVDCSEDPLPLSSGDILLFASDGLDYWLDTVCIQPEIFENLRKDSINMEAMSMAIIEQTKAMEIPFQDNLTVVTLQMRVVC